MVNNVAQGTFILATIIVPSGRVPKDVPNTRLPVGGPKDQTSDPCLVFGANECLVPNDILSQRMSCPQGYLVPKDVLSCFWDLHVLFLEVWGSSPNHRALAEIRALLQKENEHNKER